MNRQAAYAEAGDFVNLDSKPIAFVMDKPESRTGG